MHLLFKTQKIHCTCSYPFQLHQGCVCQSILYSFNVIQHYVIPNSKEKVFLIIDAQRR